METNPSAAATLLDDIRRQAPLIHNITNYVVMNSSANILLAAGASPVMAHCRAEVAEMVGLAKALVLNIGTLQEDWTAAMIVAGQSANAKGIPVILDPVGAGATVFRTKTVHKILSEIRVSVIRGNASEVLSLASADILTKGVDSTLGMTPEVITAATQIAAAHNCVIAISGQQDCITDGQHVLRVANGHPIMTRVTGLGCGLTAITGAFCAVAKGRLLNATAVAFGYYGLCGEMAATISNKPGSFFPAFLDALYTTGPEDLEAGLKISHS